MPKRNANFKILMACKDWSDSNIVADFPDCVTAGWHWLDEGEMTHFGTSKVRITPFYGNGTYEVNFVDHEAIKDDVYPSFSTNFQTFSFDNIDGILTIKGDKAPKGKYVFKAKLNKHQSSYFNNW